MAYPRFNLNPKPPVRLREGWHVFLKYLWRTRSEHHAFENGYSAADFGPIYQH